MTREEIVACLEDIVSGRAQYPNVTINDLESLGLVNPVVEQPAAAPNVSLTNCAIRMRSEDAKGVAIDAQGNLAVALDNYVLLPRERYDELVMAEPHVHGGSV